jgi:hypothetical protein
MAGLGPAIHVFAAAPKKDVDARHKAGHDDFRACRVRGPSPNRIRHPYSLFKQPISFPRRIFCARAFASLLRQPESRGSGAPRNVRVLGGTPVRCAISRHARRLARRLASRDAGRSPLGAPPWRFWTPGPRFSHRHSRRIGHSELLAPRS